MPKVSQTEAKRTKQRIIKASLKIVVEEGVSELSFANIANKAKVSRSGINAHFKRKEHIYDSLRPIIREMILKPLDVSSPQQFLESWIKVLDSDPDYRMMLTKSDRILGGGKAIADLLDIIEGDAEDVREVVYYGIGYALVNYPSK
ncbi:TetR/AcrR family transcriptional regulator [Vibrio cortegadensis]|uniref:TetR/AcrR family transcriptional regulator n=1 Tax=Vibrio cortegadensis TaxID=1328770 RepID=UPI0021C43DAE|nr:TetR/AcrR family transcriptional regulator [Vibrio cortegadensis]MDN3697273.1 TetR/AcrR family transcriptional regulator [Vibrio cortegadensis]